MSGREDFEERKRARIERLRGRAEALHSEGHARLDGAKKIAGMIPFGQPILVGHHSERGHRRDIQRIDEGYAKGFKALENARELESRANFAEESRAISADDPKAPDTIASKIGKLEKLVEQSKVVNKIIRAAKGDTQKAVAALCAAGLGLSEENAATLLKPDFAGRVGVPSYRLTNWNSEVRRLKARLKILEHAEKLAVLPDELFGEIILREADNRTQLIFPDKPSEKVREELKSHGFRWAPSTGAWQRMSSAGARHHAKVIAQRAVDGE